MPAPAPIRLSKSKFVAGVQCLKRLYWQVHQPDLADDEDERQHARLEQGQEVGLLAQARFPGGISVPFGDRIEDTLARTTALMEDASVPAITRVHRGGGREQNVEMSHPLTTSSSAEDLPLARSPASPQNTGES